jgi:hypothetical protein
MTEIETLRSVEAKMVIDDVDKDERCITFRINTDDIDDHGTVILPTGGKFEKYRALGSPVLWDHGLDVRRGKDPIAKALMVRAYGKIRPEIRARDQFFEDDFSQQRYEWYRDEKLTGVSIRFMQPNENDYGPPTDDEIRARPELRQLRNVWQDTQGKRGWVLRSWDMAEHSCTPLPSNPNAISIGRSLALLECCRSGLILPDDVKAQLEARAAEETPADPPPDKPTRTGPFVASDGSAWWIDLGDGTRAITFKDEKLAEECLRVMTSPVDHTRTLEYQNAQARARAERYSIELKRDLEDYINLHRWGALGTAR